MTQFDQNQDRSPRYTAYLVRMWQDGEGSSWRASAQSVQSGQVVRFANLNALFAFLDSQAAEAVQPGDNLSRSKQDE